MTAARRWYERALGAALVLVGLIFLLPVATWVLWAHHEYTVGLSVDWAHALPAFTAIVSGVGALTALGGIALLRRA